MQKFPSRARRAPRNASPEPFPRHFNYIEALVSLIHLQGGEIASQYNAWFEVFISADARFPRPHPFAILRARRLPISTSLVPIRLLIINVVVTFLALRGGLLHCSPELERRIEFCAALHRVDDCPALLAELHFETRTHSCAVTAACARSWSVQSLSRSMYSSSSAHLPSAMNTHLRAHLVASQVQRHLEEALLAEGRNLLREAAKAVRDRSKVPRLLREPAVHHMYCFSMWLVQSALAEEIAGSPASFMGAVS
ncbi:hypothetical protein FA95DRAFT_1605784 [Auriscalpium vulgare]|uniref:Uncharacterized protein n=1 Tax=Auriscalpium vulgare TaxID=40419 RepID=A0ACB8RW53_9AGAM|nr:hypothetical protein FA95DRAFT_1605784 [Auriscalpium vulgare]